MFHFRVHPLCGVVNSAARLCQPGTRELPLPGPFVGLGNGGRNRRFELRAGFLAMGFRLGDGPLIAIEERQCDGQVELQPLHAVIPCVARPDPHVGVLPGHFQAQRLLSQAVPDDGAAHICALEQRFIPPLEELRRLDCGWRLERGPFQMHSFQRLHRHSHRGGQGAPGSTRAPPGVAELLLVEKRIRDQPVEVATGGRSDLELPPRHTELVLAVRLHALEQCDLTIGQQAVYERAPQRPASLPGELRKFVACLIGREVCARHAGATPHSGVEEPIRRNAPQPQG